MQHEDHPVMNAVGKIIAVWIAALGSMTLAQWASIIGILSGLAAITYTLLQMYVLWRDKIVRYRPPGSATRASDTGPGELK